MSGFGTLMPQIERDYFSGDICLQQRHRGRVSKRMRRDAALLEYRKFSGGTVDELLELVSCPCTTELLAKAVWQQRSFGWIPVLFEPTPQSSLGLRPDRHPSLFAAFAQYFNLSAIEIYILYPQRQDLRDAGAGIVEEQEKEVIPLTGPAVICCGQDGLDFLAAEKADQSLDVPLERDAENTLQHRRQFRSKPIVQIMEEGANRCQPSVAGPDAVGAFLLQVLEEPKNGVGRKRFQSR